MKKLQLALIAGGVLGLAALLVPPGRSLLAGLLDVDRLSAIIHVAIFALPLAMGIAGLARPPLRAWQSGVALAGCVLGLVRLRIWDLVLHLPGDGARGALLVAALLLATGAAVISLVRPPIA